MTIKLIFSILSLLPIAFVTLGQTSQPCIVQGTISGLKNQPVYFTYQGAKGSQTDTVMAVNDSFTYRVDAPADSIVNLSIDADANTIVFFWHEPGIIHITGSVEAPTNLYISGTPENDVLLLFREQIEWVFPNRVETSAGKLIDNPEKRQATIDFIAKHPDNQTSIYLLFMLAVFNPTEVNKYTILYQDFSPKVRTSKVGKQLGELLTKR